MTPEQAEAINTPKELRTAEQRAIIFGDCNPNRQHNAYKSRAVDLVERLNSGLYLSKADKKEAKMYKREGTV